VARRHARDEGRRAHRWGRTKGKIGFHGGKIAVERPRVRGFDGEERTLPSWESAIGENWLGEWAMNQMLINVSTRNSSARSGCRGGDVPASDGAGLSEVGDLAPLRRAVDGAHEGMDGDQARPISTCWSSQIDGIHMAEDMLLVAAVGVDETGEKHPLGVVEWRDGERGDGASALSPISSTRARPSRATSVHHRWVEGAGERRSGAPSGATRRSSAVRFTRRATFWNGCQSRCNASVRSVLRQAWELDDAAKAEKLLRNLARRCSMRLRGRCRFHPRRDR